VQYVLELYLPRLGAGALPEAAARADSASEQLCREGTPVRFLRSIFLPGDEICFLVFEGPSDEAVAEAARRAEIAFERVLPAEVAPDGSEESEK
jgi:Nickel responsive protein SCO4226-like